MEITMHKLKPTIVNAATALLSIFLPDGEKMLGMPTTRAKYRLADMKDPPLLIHGHTGKHTKERPSMLYHPLRMIRIDRSKNYQGKVGYKTAQKRKAFQERIAERGF